jgi:hypothetical protein
MTVQDCGKSGKPCEAFWIAGMEKLTGILERLLFSVSHVKFFCLDLRAYCMAGPFHFRTIVQANKAERSARPYGTSSR